MATDLERWAREHTANYGILLRHHATLLPIIEAARRVVVLDKPVSEQLADIHALAAALREGGGVNV